MSLQLCAVVKLCFTMFTLEVFYSIVNTLNMASQSTTLVELRRAGLTFEVFDFSVHALHVAVNVSSC